MTSGNLIEATAVHNRETFELRVGEEIVMIARPSKKRGVPDEKVRLHQGAIVDALFPMTNTAQTHGSSQWATMAQFDEMTVTKWTEDE
jgi:hypothetical protein